MSVLRSILEKVTKGVTSSILSVSQRYFTPLVAGGSMHYTIPTVTLTGDFEIPFKIYIASNPSQTKILIGNLATDVDFIAIQASGSIRVDINGVPTNYSTSLPINKINDCVFTRVGTVGTITINGSSEALTVDASDFTIDSLMAGLTTPRFTDGILSDVGIDGQRFYKINENLANGSTIIDSSGNGQNGLAVNISESDLFTLQSNGDYENSFWPNLLFFSEQFDNGIWQKSPGVLISINSDTSPIGTLTADGITPTTGSNFVEVFQNIDIVSGNSYTQTYFLKDSGLQFIQVIGPGGEFGTFNANFDLVNGIVTASNLGTSSGLIASIEPGGNGFYRIRVTVDALSTSSNGRLALDFIKTGTTGRGVDEGAFNGSDSIIVWGAQMEIGVEPTAYVATTDTIGVLLERA